MKLERLEELKKISTKDVIVRQTLNNIEKKYYHNKYELKISLALTLFNLLGNTEMHKAMEAEDINWIDFINDNYSLIEELENGEYSKEYEEMEQRIVALATRMDYILVMYKTTTILFSTLLKDMETIFGKIENSIEAKALVD